MALISIQSECPEDLFKPPEYPVLPAGQHVFVVANELEVTAVSDPGSTNQIIKLEARCQDDDENKGIVVFDNFVLINNPTTSKQELGKKINDARLAQFAAACAVATQEEIAQGAEFDLSDFKEKFFAAVSAVQLVDVYPVELDSSTGKPKKRAQAVIKQYLFEQQENEE